MEFLFTGPGRISSENKELERQEVQKPIFPLKQEVKSSLIRSLLNIKQKRDELKLFKVRCFSSALTKAPEKYTSLHKHYVQWGK